MQVFYFIFLICFLRTLLQGRCKCKGILCLVFIRQFRMVNGLYCAIWNDIRGLQKWFEKIWETLCNMVQEFSQEKR